MKAKIFASVVLVLLLGIGCLGCSSATNKNLKLTNENSKEANLQVNQVRKDSLKVHWETFKKDAEIAVKARERQIEDLKREFSDINKEEQKCRTALDTLEQKKNGLQERLAQINKKITTDMEHLNENDEAIKTTFEKSFVRDMNELIMGLREFCKKEEY
ncbi:hypothetical protein [Lacinutrix himadriensis]|uniref:hypothetical protein n=1 Tax=Lacinutrix himadriensis TaxID=641549 RepID=UPI0006E283FE|nr:hypothetical protein [Lacinutrix himadriensis]